MKRRIIVLHSNIKGLYTAIHSALGQIGILENIKNTTRIVIKPNLTYPYYKPGVTTSPLIMREAVRLLKEYTPCITIAETDGGYGAWRAEDAFAGHGLYQLRDEYGIEIVNLNSEPRELISFQSGLKTHQIPLPTRLLHEADIIISMPVPKIHSMTGLSLSYKNQWGCVPDVMRLRRHYIFNDAIVAINRALKPAVLADGTYFLDRNGPMDGNPIRMDLIIAATNAGAFDRYVAELMGFPWRRVPHLRRAIELGDMPSDMKDIEYNVPPWDVRIRTFRLQRTLRNYIALLGFKSRFVTWLGYESWFGKVILHSILYAIVGKPDKGRINEFPQKHK